MTLIIADLVQETTSTNGQGTLTLSGAVAGFQSFAAIGDANKTYYRIKSGTNSEVGIGTYTASGTTLSRDTVLYSSAGGTTKITVAAGATVICTYPAKRAVTQGGQLTLSDDGTTPATPADGSITLFAEQRAGRMFPSIIDPIGVDYYLQSALYGTTTYMWLANNSTVSSIAWGTSFTARNNSAAQATPVKFGTSAIASMNRAIFPASSLGSSGSGVQSTNTVAWLGNSAGLGGFLFFARFGVEVGSPNSFKVLVGLSTLNATLPQFSEPSALMDTIALCKDAADTTWQILTSDASTGAKIDTGIAVTVGQILDLIIHSKPNSQSVMFYIKDAVTGADLYAGAAITTTLPLGSVFMYMHAHMQNVINDATSLALNRMYVQTRL